ncbi:MAG TPA: type II toxin-antitoxin system RelE/ParE family toxin [Gemmataceae bacterium]|jgi:plasmid stabilization system protein ParE|nr:type II toxin-antitoxin system RelE/ParE family toxin [Gemmataceae bacterium]
MSLPLFVRVEAKEDLATARDWYEQQEPGLGLRFMTQVAVTFERIQTMPEMYASIWRKVRACKLRRFPYVVYYRTLTDRTEILAVLHGGRDAAVWRSRTSNGP